MASKEHKMSLKRLIEAKSTDIKKIAFQGTALKMSVFSGQ